SDANALGSEVEWSEQVEEDVVVITGVESDFSSASGLGKRAHNLESLIAVEGRDLNGNNVFNLKKLTPEFVRKRAASDRWLKIETHDRDHAGNGAGVIEEFRDGGIAQLGEAQQNGVIAKFGGKLRFGHPQRGLAA